MKEKSKSKEQNKRRGDRNIVKEERGLNGFAMR